MTTDFRALCAELLDELMYYTEWSDAEGLKDRAGAALADEPAVPECREPVSVTEQPSDEDLWNTADLVFQANSWPKDAIRYARAVLARWGNPAPQAPAEPTVPTVMEIVELADEIEAAELGQVDLVRAALTRWGNPAPQPPAEGEVAELAEFLRACAGDHYGLGHHQFTRAAELLQRLSPPQPVPVSERLPGPEDCDADNYCWRWSSIGRLWVRQSLGRNWYDFETYWLPAHALPIPQQQENHQ